MTPHNTLNAHQEANPMTSTDVAVMTPSTWDMVLHQAEVLASSNLVAKQFRGRPQDIMTAAIMGYPLGWDVTVSMRYVHVIDGKPSVSPEGMLALVRRAGHSVTGKADATGATVTGRRADTGDSMSFTFTLDDADRAGLLNKTNWQNYPQSMCWARALSQLCRMLFSDVLLGAAYTPEELGGEVDADGNVVGLSFAPVDDATPAAAEPVVNPASDEQRADVRARLDALDPDEKARLADWWKDNLSGPLERMTADDYQTLLAWFDGEPATDVDDAEVIEPDEMEE